MPDAMWLRCSAAGPSLCSFVDILSVADGQYQNHYPPAVHAVDDPICPRTIRLQAIEFAGEVFADFGIGGYAFNSLLDLPFFIGGQLRYVAPCLPRVE
jgi:hypothetical protein